MPSPISRRRFGKLLTATGILATNLLSSRIVYAKGNVPMVRLVTGVPAGSMIDNITRQVAEVIKSDYAVNTMVENKTGAGGIMALGYFKTLPNDGSSVYVGVSSPLTIYPITHKNLPYDADKDLIPVGSLGSFDLALAVGPMVPASVTDLKSYFEWCKKNPNQANFGSPGAGSMLHFTGSMSAKAAGAEVNHIAYRGPGPAVIDLQGGTLSAAVVPLVDVAEFAAQGKVRILGTTGEERSRFVPNVLTFKEQGFGEFARSVWIAVFAPAGTPEAKLHALRNNLKKALDNAEVQSAMGRQLQKAQWGEPEALQQAILQERASWKKAVKALNFTIDS